MVTSFKYLGRLLLAADYDWLAVVQNLVKEHMVWQIMLRIMSREGAILWVSGFFFKSVVEFFALWCRYLDVYPRMGRSLGGSRTRWQGN